MCHRLSGDPVLIPDGKTEITRDDLTKLSHWDDISEADIPRLAILTDSFVRFIGDGDDASVLTVWNEGTPNVMLIEGEFVPALDAVMDVICGNEAELVEQSRPDPQERLAKIADKLERRIEERHAREAANNNTQAIKTGFVRTNTTDLLAQTFAPIKWIIPGYVPEGLTLLAGKQKLGKTWMAIDWAAAVASGGYTMGIGCEQGDVLYIDMENGDRRIQRRIFAMWPLKPVRPDLSRLEWASASPVIGKEFYAALDEWYAAVANPRLVIIDVFQRIKPNGSAAKNAYENDYAALTGLQQWATLRGVGVVALHHLKKGGSDSDDPFEKLSGSNGLSACADTTLVLDRSAQGCTLYGRGRDVEEIESAVTFDKTTFRWNVQGNVTDVRRSDERGNILQALLDAGESMSPNVIADVTGQRPGNVRRLLLSMVKAQEVRKTGRGSYAHPAVTDETHTTGNNGNKVTTPKDDMVGNKVTEEIVSDDNHPLGQAIVTDVTVVTAPLDDDDIPSFLKRKAS